MLVKLEQLDLTDSPDSLESVDPKDKLEELDRKVCKYIYIAYKFVLMPVETISFHWSELAQLILARSTVTIPRSQAVSEKAPRVPTAKQQDILAGDLVKQLG